MPAIEWLHVIGFKSIAAIEKLVLGQVSVIIGANGSGKSNFLQLFDVLRATQDDRLTEYVARHGGAERLLHHGSKVGQWIGIQMGFADLRGVAALWLIPTAQDSLAVIHHPPIHSEADGWLPQFSPADEILREDLNVDPQGRRAAFHRLYHFHDTGMFAAIRKPCDVNDNRFLRSDGSNLPAVLYLLKSMHLDSYRMIREAVSMVAPFFDDFLLEPQLLNPSRILLEWRHRHSDAYFDASALSDGTLRFIALATLLLQPPVLRPPLILIDEPELGLHPSAVSLLASLVRQASQETQIILSTQSPQLLDHFSPGEVLVAELVEGASRFKRLSDEELAAWLEDYSLGQLWEKNEIGGRPGGR